MPARPDQPPPDHLRHRERLRERFLEGGSDAMPDYELLELALFRSLPRRDTKGVAKELLRRFGSFAEVVMAPSERLQEVDGVGPSVALDLGIMAAACRRMNRRVIEGRTVLSSWQAVLDFCHAEIAFQEREQFWALFLDKRNGLILSEMQGEGTVDHAPVYPRQLVKRALDLAATAVILVHNHPSGDPTPSQADIQMTREIVTVAKPLGISVHDHIIVGRNGHASFRGLKLL